MVLVSISPLAINVVDSVAVDEIVSVSPGPLSISVTDGVVVDEVVTVAQPNALTVNVTDGVTVSETTTLCFAFSVIIDHETGDLSQYTSTVTDSGNLSVVAAAALIGTNYGLQAVINDVNPIYGQYTLNTVSTSGVVRARFYLDLNTLAMAATDNFYTFIFYNSIGAGFGGIKFRWSGASYQILAYLTEDSTTESVVTVSPPACASRPG